MVIYAGERVLKPRPIAGAGGDAAGRAEAIEGIVGEDVGIEGLIPHRIGHDNVMRAHLAIGRTEFRIDHRVAARDLDIHVVDHAVHLRDGVVLCLKLLRRQPERHLARRIEFTGHELELDQKARRTAGVIVTVLAGARAHDVRHQEADFSRREELAGALAGAFREFPQQIFVGAAEEVRLNICEAEPITRIGKSFDDFRAAWPD